MTIEALPESTSRLLASSVVVTNPVSLVKELLDNAIDAEASAIEIHISLNTVDKIEVRDNGHGIHPDDYDSLGRRSHTSKIRSFEDLRQVTRTTLGFRGQALASANSLAKITIITKTSSDGVAAVLEITTKNGGVSKQKSVSAPSGTTVSITGLYHEMPVREKAVLKEADRNLVRIRELLESYAMARPQLKLAFKVLKTPKLHWAYSPMAKAGVKEAVLQLIGVQEAQQCFEKLLTFGTGASEDQECSENSGDGGNFKFEAYIIRPDADKDHLPRHRFVSIDRRPVSSAKGTTRKLLSIYQKHLVSVFSARDGARLPGDLFIRLDITCPPGSYDVNIESSKDDVLFDNEANMIHQFEQLCQEVYGSFECTQHLGPPKEGNGKVAEPLIDNHQGTPLRIPPSSSAISETGDFIDVARADLALLSSTDTEVHDQFPLQPNQARQMIMVQRVPSETPRRTWNPINKKAPADNSIGISGTLRGLDGNCDGEFEMPGALADMSVNLSQKVGNESRLKKSARTKGSIGVDQHGDASCEALVQSGHDVTPWSIARSSTRHEYDNRPPFDALQSQNHVHQGVSTSESLTPEPKVLRHPVAPPRDLDIPPSLRHPLLSLRQAEASDCVPGKTYNSALSGSNERSFGQPTSSLRRRVQPPWTPPSSLHNDQGQWEGRYSSQKRPVTYNMKQSQIDFGGSDLSRKSHLGHLSKVSEQEAAHVDSTRLGNLLNSSREGFSTARQNYLEELSQQQNDHSSSTGTLFAKPIGLTVQQPLISLRVMDIGTHDSPVDGQEPIKTLLPSGDPRAYLLRRQKSMAAADTAGKLRKFKRLKSSLMPLENVPADGQTHSLVLPAEINLVSLPIFLQLVEKYDKYILEGNIEDALDIDLSEGRRIERRLASLLSCKSEALIGQRATAQVKLGPLLKGKANEM